jgi:dihydroorotate dehydrogenase electron transfer subunit
MYQEKAEVLANNRISADCYKMFLGSKNVAAEAKPGQFVHLKISNNKQNPFLRRPFAVHHLKNKDEFAILYKIRGKTTQLMKSLKKGDMIDLIGPLGKGFVIDEKIEKYILVAGGIGLAPLFFLAEELIKNGKNLEFFYGARTKEQLLCLKETDKIECNFSIATDDGSLGLKGNVNDVLEKYLKDNKGSDIAVFAAGPKVMLKETALICKNNKISLQVSMDEIMACGVGVCLGCAIMTTDGYKLTCKDGPVFKAEEIIWE